MELLLINVSVNLFFYDRFYWFAKVLVVLLLLVIILLFLIVVVGRVAFNLSNYSRRRSALLIELILSLSAAGLIAAVGLIIVRTR